MIKGTKGKVIVNKNLAGILMIILIVWTVSLGAIYILGLTQTPLRFSIQLTPGLEIKQGTEGILNFEVRNNWFSPMTNVTVINSIKGKPLLSEVSELSNLSFFQKDNGEFAFDTASLSKGEYILSSNLSYTQKGKIENTELTLTLKIK